MRKDRSDLEENEIIELLNLMEPKIMKSLSNTAYQEQEDLKQELHLKMLETIAKGRIKEVSGFWELKSICEGK